MRRGIVAMPVAVFLLAGCQRDPAETARRVFKALEQELTEPTTRHRGRFVERRRRPPE